MKKMKFMLILCLFAAALQGGVVTLINPSFEDDGAVNGSGQAWTDYDITGWFDTTATPIGKDRGNVTQTPYGDHLCDIQGVGTNIGQEIGDTTLIGKTVEVSYIVTRRTNETLETDHYVRIIAGTSVTYIGGVVLSEVVYDTPLTAADTYNEVELELPVIGDPGANDTLWLVLENNLPTTATGVQLHIDNFAVETFDYIKPLPAENVAPVDEATDVPSGSVLLDWDAGNDPQSLIQGYQVYCEQTDHLGTVTTLANGVVVTSPTDHNVTVVKDASVTWRIDTYIGDISDPNNIITGEGWSFDTERDLTTDQLMAHWTMDQDDFTDDMYQDSTINNHDADPNSAPAAYDTYPAFIPGVKGDTNGATLMYPDAWASAGTWNPSGGTNELTVSAWVYWSGLAGGQIVIKKDDWGHDNMMWQLSLTGSGQIRFRTGDSGHDVDTSDEVMPVGQWTFVCATCDASGGKVYVGCELLEENATTILGTKTEAEIRIGADAGTPAEGVLPGYLDDIKIYNYAQTREEIITEYYNMTGEGICVDRPAYDMTGPGGEPDCILDIYEIALLAAQWLDCGWIPASTCD